MAGGSDINGTATSNGVRHVSAAPHAFPLPGHRTVAQVEAHNARFADLRRNDARTREIAALRLAGWKRAAIAAKLGIGETTIGYHLRKAGISLRVGRPRAQPAQQRAQDLTDGLNLAHGEGV